jgi:hypothetical protein
MRLYVESGHGKAPLELDAERRKLLGRCATAIGDPERLVRLLAYWLFRPDPFWRDARKGSALLATLLRPSKLSERWTEAESWAWDGTIRVQTGPPATGPPRRGRGAQLDADLAYLQRRAEKLNAQ